MQEIVQEYVKAVLEIFGSYCFYALLLLVNKWQRKKVALIAVAIKLVKQSFAIAKSGSPYDEKYVSVLPE